VVQGIPSTIFRAYSPEQFHAETSQCVQQNRLFYGDNLDVLRRFIPDESIDLVYLDPPFNNQRGAQAADTFAEMVGSDGRLAEHLEAFRVLLGEVWAHGSEHLTASRAASDEPKQG
jgi:hypothetical protein